MLDKTINTLVGLGIPGLILFYLIAISGYSGAAAISFALAAFGPFGIIGGVISFAVTGMISAALAEYGFDRVNEGVVREYKKQGFSKQFVLDKLDDAWYLSNAKRRQFKGYVEEYFDK